MNGENIKKMLENYRNGKLSHAILIETNNQSKCYNDLLIVIKELMCFDNGCNNCSVCNLIEGNKFPNFFVIEPDGKNIKKEQILNLRNMCSIVPVLSKNNVYIILSAEKLNASSSNSMLKFIEEPYEDTFGFFIASGKDNVINTIKSRCQIVVQNYDKVDFLETLEISSDEFNQYMSEILNLLKKLLVEKVDPIVMVEFYFNSAFEDRDKYLTFLRILLNIYDDVFNSFINNVDLCYNEFEFLLNLGLNNIQKKRELIVDIIDKISFNINVKLSITSLMINMSEINEI